MQITNNTDKTITIGFEGLGAWKKYDPVQKPKHYNLFRTEVIDMIESALTEEEFKGYLKGNMLKYRLRAGEKNNRSEDLEKSNWYQDKLRDKEGKDKIVSKEKWNELGRREEIQTNKDEEKRDFKYPYTQFPIGGVLSPPRYEQYGFTTTAEGAGP